MVLFKYIFFLSKRIMEDTRLCFMPVPWKHILLDTSVMELKIARPEDFHDMLLSVECQILLHVSNYSSISTCVKGIPGDCIVFSSVSIPPFYSKVLLNSDTTFQHFKISLFSVILWTRQNQFYVVVRLAKNFSSLSLHVVQASLVLGGGGMGVWNCVCVCVLQFC